MTTTSSLINLEYLRIMTDGDSDMEKVMLEMLALELPEEFEKMKALTAEKNWEELFSVSHKMKSTLTFVGNVEMINANKNIEEISKTQTNLDRIPGLLAILESRLNAVLEEIKAEL